MASLQSFLAEANELGKKKVYVESSGFTPELEEKMGTKYSAKPRKKKAQANMSYSMFLLADFGVPMWQRAAIEAKEGFKTLKGVAKDVVTKEAWTNPKKKKQWMENMGQGFSEARNRVKQSLRKANDSNIEKELMKNKSLDLQVDKMRQSAKKKYAAGGVKELAPLTRSENDGLLQVDKRYGIGQKAKK